MKHKTAHPKTTESFSTGNIKHNRNFVLIMTIFPVLVISLAAGVFFAGNTVRKDTSAATLTIAPPQPGAIVYRGDAPASYAHAGAMVDMNSAELPGAKAVSNAGGTVLVYVAIVSTAEGGKYNTTIRDNSSCGPAIGTWPGNPPFVAGGTINNIANLIAPNPSVPYGNKLKCVLEKVVSENPHMGGFFADDLGTTNGVGTSAFGGGCKIPTDAYYNAVSGAAKIYREVADAHGILFLVNGSWDGRCKGGYPNRSITGSASADGYTVEHHPVNENGFRWDNIINSGQWATQSRVTNGNATHLIIGNDPAWRRVPNVAWISEQNVYDSGTTPAPWSGFHASGLPSKVSGTSTPPPPAPGPTPTPMPSPSPSPSPSPTPAPLAKPAIPSNVKLTPGDHKLVITWNASPAAEKVDNYQVYLNGAYAYSTTTSPTYTITGTPGQTFTVRVSAHNAAGFGGWTTSFSGVIGSPPGVPPPAPTPAPAPPPISVPGSNPTKPVPIPSNIHTEPNGSIIADFNGDGLNELARDINNDGSIDPMTEIEVNGAADQSLTDTNQSPITIVSDADMALLNSNSNDMTVEKSDTVSVKIGPLPKANIAKPVAYTFVVTEIFTLSGLAGYLAITKLAILASLRAKLGF